MNARSQLHIAGRKQQATSRMIAKHAAYEGRTMYSNVTWDELSELIRQEQLRQSSSTPSSVNIRKMVAQCRYAEDTGKRAFPAAPCRGNRIICHRIAGHTSYTKACTPEKCRFYEKKEEAWNA